MGQVYLCLGKNAEVPYYFEKSRIHIWNVEELCYFIRENAWLLEPGVLNEELIAWVAQQCSLGELAQKLASAARTENPVIAFVETLFTYTGYYGMQELEQVEKILHINESSTDLERTKVRGDYYLESQKYVLALKEYEGILPQLTGSNPALVGAVTHNCGVACAKLFFFDRAADYFEKAWKLTGSQNSAQQFLAAKRFALGQQGYVDFLADYPDFYQASLLLEEKMQKTEENWQRSKEAAGLLEDGLNRNGSATVCQKLMEEHVLPLQKAYKSYCEE